MDHYAVFGNPIAHSKSPQIHTAFARQTHQQLEYTAQLAPLDGFADAVKVFVAAGGKGLNITVPFKQEAWQLASELSARAQRAGAVNTLVIRGVDNYLGDNTDGVGLVRDLVDNNHIQLQHKNILVMGAGGAVRGVLEPLLEQQPGQLVIVNRTAGKAVQLAEDFSDLGNVTGCGYDELQGMKFDVIINGTSASLQGELPSLPDDCLNAHAAVYDMMYAAQPTTFMQWAQRQGAETICDGLGMLVEQAAEAFYIWRGVRPDTSSVIASIREAMKSD